MPELNIDTSANEVVALLNQGRAREAAAQLDALRRDQSPVVQEALDRYVAVRAGERLATLRQPGNIEPTDEAAVRPTLTRLGGVTNAPRYPDAAETANLSQAQQYDVYASIVATRGNDAARDALGTQDRVVLGMRNDDRTTDNRGRGEYNDRVVVLWRGADGERHAREFNTVTTDPTAQYDEHAKTTPRSPGFGNVLTRPKTEGEDVNGDRVRDMGRLAEGTTDMRATTHPRTGHPDEFALRPTDAAVRDGARRVERDTNGDGWFDSRDVNGVQALNDTFKIHRGSNNNTDSAGCQTIGGGEYDAFVRTVRGTPGQTNWQYVLTSVEPGQTQERARTDGQAPAAPNPANDPRNPAHPDHALQSEISDRLRALGGTYAQNADAYSLSLLHEAKERNLTRVDRIVTSNAVGDRAAGDTLFMVQGRTGDPAANRVSISAAALAATTVEGSLERLQQQQERQQAARTPVAPTQNIDPPVQAAPAIGGR